MRREELKGPAIEIYDFLVKGEEKQAFARGQEILKSATGEALQEAHELLGILAFQSNDVQTAISHFQEARETVEKYFNLTCAHAVLGDAAASEEQFEICGQMYTEQKQAGTYEGYSGSEMQYTYASHLVQQAEFSTAKRYIDNLAKIYLDLKIMDDSFLAIRQVPPFMGFLELLKEYGEGNSSAKQEHDAFINQFKSCVDEYGQEMLKEAGY